MASLDPHLKYRPPWDDPPVRRLPLLAVVLLTGCGSSPGPKPAPRPPSAEQVIRSWADDLRAGRFSAANATFAVPATVANGGPRLRLRSRADIDGFNRTLPCGAVVTGT